MELYRWQEECLLTWKNNRCRGIADVATGTGKTVLALASSEYLLKEHPNLHIRVVVPTRKLAAQWKSDIIRFFHREGTPGTFVRIFRSPDRTSAPVFTVYVINTARDCISSHIIRDMEKGIPTFLVVDECHHAASPVNRGIFHFMNMKSFRPDLCFLLGLSATPDRPDYPDILTGALGNVIYRYGAKRAGRDRVVNPFRIVSTSVRLTGEELAEYGSLSASISRMYALLLQENPELKGLHDARFFRALHRMASDDEDSSASGYLNLIRKRRSLLYTAENRFRVIMEMVRHSRRQRCIIFSERIDQCEDIFLRLQKCVPNRVGHYHSDMDSDTRRRNMDLFALGEYRILVTCRALDEGLNVPDASVGIIASSSSAERQHIQRLGRILRRSDGKGLSVLYYIYTENTIENPVFLTDAPAVSQRYLGPSQGFICMEYENAAFEMRKEMKDRPPEEQSAFEKAVEKASGSADWLYPAGDYDSLIREAASAKEADYWRIMRRLSEIHRERTVSSAV